MKQKLTKKQRSILRGRQKIMALIDRGIRVNTKPIFMKRITQAVKNALT